MIPLILLHIAMMQAQPYRGMLGETGWRLPDGTVWILNMPWDPTATWRIALRNHESWLVTPSENCYVSDAMLTGPCMPIPKELQ